MTAPTLLSDAPITGTPFDTLARLPVAARLVELVTASDEQPIVVGLLGGPGTGKTSVLHMAGELCAARADLRAFAVDGWIAGEAARVNDELLREVALIFEEERVVGQTEKVRDKLFAVGDVVSAVARFAGAKVDIRGGLEKSPDKLRDEVMKHTETIGKRIVVFVDHLDRMAPADAVAVVKLVARWGTFPYFAFVLAFDRDQLARKLRRIDGNADDLERVISVELPLPPADRDALAGHVRGGLADLAKARGVDAGPALALFAADGGPGLAMLSTVREAKRFLNAVSAALPLATVDLRTSCLVELVRELVPAAYPTVVTRLPLNAAARAELATFAVHHRSPELVTALFAAFA